MNPIAISRRISFLSPARVPDENRFGLRGESRDQADRMEAVAVRAGAPDVEAPMALAGLALRLRVVCRGTSGQLPIGFWRWACAALVFFSTVGSGIAQEPLLQWLLATPVRDVTATNRYLWRGELRNAGSNDIPFISASVSLDLFPASALESVELAPELVQVLVTQRAVPADGYAGPLFQVTVVNGAEPILGGTGILRLVTATDAGGEAVHETRYLLAAPRLTVALSSDLISIEWPVAFDGFDLEKAVPGPGEFLWERVAESPIVLDEARLVELPRFEAGSIFRLTTSEHAAFHLPP